MADELERLNVENDELWAKALGHFTLGECGSCHAPVIWCVLQNSTRIPIDPEPHPQGNVSITRQPYGLLASPVSAKLAFGRKDLRRAHFATCPNADQWRNARRRSAAHTRRLGLS